MQQQLFRYSGEFNLELGGKLSGFELSYSAMGTLNDKRNNVVWVCHALTANADFSDWWSGLVESLYDPSEYFIVCANMLGGCYGSTGPLSINPEDGKPYFHGFPSLTNRDIVGSFDLLRQHLEITGIHTIIGGSMGGQQALEWCIQQPSLVSNLVLVGTNAVHSPWGVAFNESQRMAIATDPTWSKSEANAGMNGMRSARAIALLSYRSYQCYLNSQSEADNEVVDNFRASSYQQYQGDKLHQRFNAYTYWYLSKAMDSHNVGRGRGGVSAALSKITANTTIVGIRSDVLFPLEEQRFLAMNIRESVYHEIDSDYGHDGFLLELDQLTNIITGNRVPNSKHKRANG
ncbi:MAG: homoserine O-acetyltransferase [Cyclobacteriaceae bacterium]|nr:MAG: homoserine O-acetyltransferase [Cyclobacteriaceae bacterium]